MTSILTLQNRKHERYLASSGGSRRRYFQLYIHSRNSKIVSKFEVTLGLTVSQSVCLGIEHPCGTCEQILLPVGMLLSEICGLISVGRPLWREDGSAICSVITQWSESRGTCNRTLLSHLRLPQPWGLGSRVYIPQEQGGPVIPPGTGFPLRCHFRLASYQHCACELDSSYR
jgi:hypothetical protein